jgi:hypothetical protein
VSEQAPTLHVLPLRALPLRAVPLRSTCGRPHPCPPAMQRRILEQIVLFHGLSGDELASIGTRMTSLAWSAGEALFSAGEPAEIDAGAFREVMLAHPSVALGVLDVVSGRLARARSADQASATVAIDPGSRGATVGARATWGVDEYRDHASSTGKSPSTSSSPIRTTRTGRRRLSTRCGPSPSRSSMTGAHDDGAPTRQNGAVVAPPGAFKTMGVNASTAVLPNGWETRTVQLAPDGPNGALARCLDPHDLCVAKLVRGDDKDIEFVEALVAAGLIDPVSLVRICKKLPVSDTRRSITIRRAQAFLQRQGLRNQEPTSFGRVLDSVLRRSR